MWNIVGPQVHGPIFEEYGGVRILRPGWKATIDLRNRSEANFRQRFSVGVYKGDGLANTALKHQYAFYSDELARLVPLVASRSFLELLLDQYDRSCEIDALYKNHSLGKKEKQQWEETGPKVRRALKHLAELIVQARPRGKPNSSISKQKLFHAAESCLLCCEQMVQLYMESDLSHELFPEDTVLEVYPEGRLDVFDTHSPKNFTEDFMRRVRCDAEKRLDLAPFKGSPMDPECQNQFLGEALKKEVGLDLLGILEVICAMVDNGRPDPSGFPVLFCNRQMMIEVASKGKKCPQSVAAVCLDGFTVSSSGVIGENRKLYRPQQEHRALRRGFFEMPHETGTHLAWSEKMAKECFITLVTEIPFQRLPPEWEKGEVLKARSHLSNAMGKWFEEVVYKSMDGLGLVGLKSVKICIGRGKDRIKIPRPVGEIDYLGLLPMGDALIVIESKCVKGALEPRMAKREVDSFTGTKGYAEQLRRKVEWVTDNLEAVNVALKSEFSDSASFTEVKRVHSAIVTYYPSCASYFIDGFPCVALSELVSDYKESNGWPY